MLQAGLLAAGVAAATQESQYGALAVGALGIGATAWQARYGRSDELEADRYGVVYMVRAGYDPQGAAELEETCLKFSEGRDPNSLAGLFACHPPTAELMPVDQDRADKDSD